MELVSESLVLLAASIFLALIVERSLEIIKSIYDYLEVRLDWVGFWNKRSLDLQKRFENRVLRNKGGNQKNLFLYLTSSFISTDLPGYEGVLVISANKVRNKTITFSFKILGLILGILIAFWVDLNLFKLVDQLNYCVQCEPTSRVDVILRGWLGTTISGVAIGLGSGPVHKLIAAIDLARKNRQSINV